MEQNTLIQRMQDDLEKIERELAKINDYKEQLENRATGLRSVIGALREVVNNEELQRELLPHLFPNDDSKEK